jgi:hypothetical protein
MRGSGEAPIPFSELIEVSEATLGIAESISSGQPVNLHASKVSSGSSPTQTTTADVGECFK